MDTANQHDSYVAVLAEFGSYGFRKTSMVGLAAAAGVSRQTLYNRFSNKDAVLDWAVNGLADETRRDALSCLAEHSNGDSSGQTNGHASRVADTLQEVFWRWLGTIAVMLHSHRHAEEIFGLGKAALSRSNSDPLEGISSEISAFLRSQQVRTSSDSADNTAFLLAMSAKGVMQTCGTETKFRAGMARVIAGAGIC